MIGNCLRPRPSRNSGSYSRELLPWAAYVRPATLDNELHVYDHPIRFYNSCLLSLAHRLFST